MIFFDDFSKNIVETTLKYEGGYSNNPADKGGETYRGISRVSNRTWAGWAILDKIANKKQNQIFSQLEAEVKQFYYKNYFQVYNLDKLNSSKVALSIFDFVVNSGMGNAKPKITEAVNKAFNINFSKFTPEEIEKLNKLNPDKLALVIHASREAFIEKIIPKYPMFANGWRNRMASLRSLLTSGATAVKSNYKPIVIGLIILISVVVVYFMFKNKMEVAQ